jgi:hypothetical protein
MLFSSSLYSLFRYANVAVKELIAVVLQGAAVCFCGRLRGYCMHGLIVQHKQATAHSKKAGEFSKLTCVYFLVNDTVLCAVLLQQCRNLLKWMPVLLQRKGMRACRNAFE